MAENEEKKREKKLAIIVAGALMLDRTNCLVGVLTLSYGGQEAQNFGNKVLMTAPDSATRRDNELAPNYAAVFIDSILRIAGVPNWASLPGRNIRVDADDDRVHGIGHVLKDEWFYPEEKFREMAEARKQQEVKDDDQQQLGSTDNVRAAGDSDAPESVPVVGEPAEDDAGGR